METFDVVLASGAEHLKSSFEKHGFRVFTQTNNIDDKRFFPNSDIYVRIPEVEKLSDRRVVIIQSCTGSSPAVDEYFTTADRIQELILMLDTLQNPVHVEKTGFKEYKTEKIQPPKKIEVVVTFQPFALQDKAFKTGEAVSCRCATEQIALRCDMMWIVAPVVDSHYPWVQDLIRKGVYQEINISGKMIEFAAQRFGFEEYTVIAPDEGAQERFGVPGLSKRRIDSFSIEMSGDIDVKGKKVIVIDDLTKSGSTLLKARELARTQGATEVGLVVTHITPIKGRGEKLMENLLENSEGRVITSNTVYSQTFCEKRKDLIYDVTESIIEHLNKEVQ